jgi:hypothetical protein
MTTKSLWVQYAAASGANLDYVSFEGCTFVAEFIKKIRNNLQLAIPEKARITIYKPDGVTEIGVGDSPAAYLAENSPTNTLFVKATLATVLSEFEQQSLSVNISNQEEDLRNALDSYARIGEVLKDEPIVCDIWNTLQSLKGNPIPFVFIEESSGAGKAQIAFALKSLISVEQPKVEFLYLLCSRATDTSQKIYRVSK